MNMLVLDTVNKSIEVLMAAAPATTQPDFTSHYADSTASAFTEGSNDGTLNGVTAVTLVAAPAASTRRIVREMVIYNADTVAVNLTVRLKNGASYRVIWKGTLGVGESWQFSNTDAGGASLDTITLQGADIVAAATTDVGAATGYELTITGNTTITSFGTANSGVFRILKFSGTPLLTYNATSLKLPGAANCQVVAGDVYIFVREGSGNWKCVGRLLIGDLPVADGGTGASTVSAARTNLEIGTTLATLADDTATSFTPANDRGKLFIYDYSLAIRAQQRMFDGMYRVGATFFLDEFHIGTLTQKTTGVLTGTTGADGYFTVSVHTDGKIYIENRLGGNAFLYYSIL